MPSQIELAIRAFRAAVLRQEQAATRTLITAYQPARERLIKRIDELVNALQEAGTLTPSELARFERAIALSEQVEAEVTRLAQIANQVIPETQGRMVALASENARSMVLATIPVSRVGSIATAWNRVPFSAVESLVGTLSDGSPISRWLMQFTPQVSESVKNALTEAVTIGRNPRAVAADLAKQIDFAEYRLLNMSRTTILDSYRSSQLATYEANRDISTGYWVWLSAQDDRCCLSCLSLDGQKFSIDTQFQPCHNACRCSSYLEVAGVPPIERELASDWFMRQPEDVQRKVVPATAFEGLKAGTLQLSDFSVLRRDSQWGDRYQQATVTQARAIAADRIRNAA